MYRQSGRGCWSSRVSDRCVLCTVQVYSECKVQVYTWRVAGGQLNAFPSLPGLLNLTQTDDFIMVSRDFIQEVANMDCNNRPNLSPDKSEV